MSLKDILEDIKGDATNVEIPSSITVSSEKTAISDFDTKEATKPLKVHRISEETLQKINTRFNLLLLRSNIASMPRVDYNTAMEVFTMLPDVSKVEQAKITSAPSIINKQVLEKIFKENTSNKLSPDIVENLSDLKNIIEENSTILTSLINYFKTFISTVESRVQAFQSVAPTVVEYSPSVSKEKEQENKLVNLYTEKIETILSLDDTKVEYEKYSGVLVNMYRELYYNETLDDLYKTFNILPPKSDVSLSHLVEYCQYAIEALERYRKDFENYVNSFNTIYSREIRLNEETLTLVNNYNDLAFKIEVISRLKAITDNKHNCFEKAAEIILFLD